MLFGTKSVISSSVAPVNFTAENQRLKVSALTWGLRAAASFAQSWEHFSSMRLVNSVN